MTASERLRELYATLHDPYLGNALRDALPGIIGVVEAAQIAEEVHGCPQLTKSLAALNAKLTADGND